MDIWYCNDVHTHPGVKYFALLKTKNFRLMPKAYAISALTKTLCFSYCFINSFRFLHVIDVQDLFVLQKYFKINLLRFLISYKFLKKVSYSTLSKQSWMGLSGYAQKTSKESQIYSRQRVKYRYLTNFVH